MLLDYSSYWHPASGLLNKHRHLGPGITPGPEVCTRS